MLRTAILALALVASLSSAKNVGRYDLSYKLAPGGNYRTFTINVKPTRLGGVPVCAYAGRIVLPVNEDGSCSIVTLHHLSYVRPEMNAKKKWIGMYCGYDYSTDGPLMHTNILRPDCPDILVMSGRNVVDTLFYGSDDNIRDYYKDGDDPVYPEFFYNQSVLQQYPKYKKQIEYLEKNNILISTRLDY